MSRTELERLARIRMQVTGETLERAMAVLEGQTTASTPQSTSVTTRLGAAEGIDLDNGEAENGEPDEADPAVATDKSNGDPEKASKPDARRMSRRRGHLRGL
ncbi:hypothetical protein [Streptomyces tubercidicus]|uniref:hypothetical protein n=1 Tax=Streptomyces tubercidicus TaxID=47759 RepID=UPI0034661E2B